jgi:hypothetical protein
MDEEKMKTRYPGYFTSNQSNPFLPGSQLRRDILDYFRREAEQDKQTSKIKVQPTVHIPLPVINAGAAKSPSLQDLTLLGVDEDLRPRVVPNLSTAPPLSPALLRRPMKLISPYSGEMECQVCGSQHFASIKPRSGGRYYRGSWQCSNEWCPTSRRYWSVEKQWVRLAAIPASEVVDEA